MNLEESLLLFHRGRDAWNAWARELSSERGLLEAAGFWTSDTGDDKRTEAARAVARRER